MRRDIDLEATLVAKYAALSPLLNERARRGRAQYRVQGRRDRKDLRKLLEQQVQLGAGCSIDTALLDILVVVAARAPRGGSGADVGTTRLVKCGWRRDIGGNRVEVTFDFEVTRDERAFASPQAR